MSLLAELKRRNVVKVSMAYLALGWVVIEVTTTVTPVLNLPEWLPSVVVARPAFCNAPGAIDVREPVGGSAGLE